MKFLRYLLLGIIAYGFFMMLLFPVSMVVNRFNVDPIKLSSVTGMIWSGNVEQLEVPNTSLPTGPDIFLIEDINWKLAPSELLKGGAAVAIDFKAYGGAGSGTVSQLFSGNQALKDFAYTVSGEGISALLDPFIKIAGDLNLTVKELIVKNQLLDTLQARLQWKGATLEIPTFAKLGNISVDIKPDDQKHILKIISTGGDILITGEVEMEKNGAFKSDILIKTTANTPVALSDMLRTIARPASDGSYRIRRSGNINRLM